MIQALHLWSNYTEAVQLNHPYAQNPGKHLLLSVAHNAQRTEHIHPCLSLRFLIYQVLFDRI